MKKGIENFIIGNGKGVSMNDQNELNGRQPHHWSGRDRDKDTAALADKIAAVLPLFQRDGGLFRLEGGKLVGVALAEFRGLVEKAICTERAVNRDGVWQREFVSFGFPPKPRFNPTMANPTAPAALEPDDKVLDLIYRHELAWRLPRVEKG
jgi:hypothetical protein